MYCIIFPLLTLNISNLSMKIFICTLLLCFAISLETNGQCQIPNGSFEEWQDVTDVLSGELGIPLIFPVKSPEDWMPVARPEDLLTSEDIMLKLGQDSLDVEVFKGLGRVSPGAEGTEYALLLGGDQYSFISDVVATFVCDGRPERVTGYFKYLSELEHDSINIRVLLQSGSNTDAADAIGIATFTAYGGPPEFFKFEADFIYFNGQIPDNAIVSVTSGRYVSWPEDTTYYIIDEIAFEGGQSTVALEDFEVYYNYLLAPNPVKDITRILTVDHTLSVLEIYDNVGRLVGEINVSRSQDINLSHLPRGLYLARLSGENGSHIQKITKL